MQESKAFFNHGDEAFNYARDIFRTQGGELVVIEGPGVVKMNHDAKAYATVLDLRERQKPGTLLSASVVLSLIDSCGRQALVLLRRAEDAQFDPGMLQFPAGRCGPWEPACDTVLRELFEEVRIEDDGAEVVPGDGRLFMQDGLQEVYFVPSEGMQASRLFRCASASFVEKDNTLEFYFQARVRVRDLDRVRVTSPEPYHRVQVVRPQSLPKVLSELTSSARQACSLAPAAFVLAEDLLG